MKVPMMNVWTEYSTTYHIFITLFSWFCVYIMVRAFWEVLSPEEGTFVYRFFGFFGNIGITIMIVLFAWLWIAYEPW